MESNRIILTLVFLTVLASGCAHVGGGSQTITEGPESVVVESLSVQPSQIYEDQSVRVTMTAANAGNVPAEVSVGENGTQIITDYCPDIFSNNGHRFSASTTTNPQTQESYTLKPGRRINLRWVLDQQGDVPLYGKRCNLKFSVPFNYSVQAYRQIQIKQNREIQGSPKLSSKSSSGPMVLAIDTIPGVTGEPSTYINSENGDQRINILIQLINSRPQEEYRKGLIQVYKESFYVNSTTPLNISEEFEDGEMRIVNEDYYSGSNPKTKCSFPESERMIKQGRSITIRCSVSLKDVELDSPSVLSEISAGINYTYIKDAGQREVRVETRGN